MGLTMKNKLLWFTLGLATVVCTAAIVFQSTSTRVLYASQMGCALNSDVYNGGGTDDTTALQAALNLATAKGCKLVIDGPALISKSLVIPSNTKVEFLPGAGLFVAPHSDCWALGNAQNTNYSTTNIVIEGGLINCNGNFQSEFITNGHAFGGSPGVHGMWLAGVDNATVRGVTLLNSKCYAYLISDSRNVYLENISAKWTNNIAAGTNILYGNDGLHVQGNVSNLRLFGLYDYQGGDDTFALSCDETDFTLPVNDPRWTINSGALSNIWLENIFADNCSNVCRTIMQSGCTNAYIYNFTLKNYRGSTRNNGWIAGPEHGAGVLPMRNWTIDGMNITVTGDYNLTAGFPPFSFNSLVGDFLTLNNIRWYNPDNSTLSYTPACFTLPFLVTNIVMNNIFAKGGPVNISTHDALISMDETTGTNIPNVTLNNISGFSFNRFIAPWDSGGSFTQPNGVWRVSNLQYDPGTIVNLGFTNFMVVGGQGANGIFTGANVISGNGSGITNLPSPVQSLAALTSGVWFTNTSGRPQEVRQSFTITEAAVAGVAMVHLITGQQGAALGTWVTNASFGQQTLGTSLATTNVGQLSWCVSNSLVYCFTNQLVGAGNAITPRPNTSQVIQY